MNATRRNWVLRSAAAGGFLGSIVLGAGIASAQYVTPVPPAQPPRPHQRAADKRPVDVNELRNIVIHMDHSIEILSTEEPDRKGLRKEVLSQIKRARDEVQREVDEMEKKNPHKDVQEQHQHDKAVEPGQKKAVGDQYYPGLVRVQEYLRNDEQTLSREPEDKNNHRKTVLKILRNAQKNIQKEMDEYAASHPGVRR